MSWRDEAMISFEAFEDLLAEGVLHAVLVLVDHLPLELLLGQVLLGDGVEGDGGADFGLADVLGDGAHDVVEVVLAILVGALLDVEEQLVVVVLVAPVELVLVRNAVLDVHAQDHRRLVGPAARHVLDGVPAAAQDHCGHSELQHVVHAGRVALYREVEVPQSVLRNGVGAALHHAGVGTVGPHHRVHHLLEELEVGRVVDALLERHVHREVLADALADGVERAGAREEVLVELVEGDGHDPVGVVEGLLHAVAVVHVDVEVEHPRVDLEQLQDADHDIVHVAEPAGLRLLGVVVAARPVDGDVGDAGEDDVRGIDAAARRQLAEVVEPVEAGTVEALVDLEERLQLGVVPDLALLVLLVLRDDLVLLASDPLLEVLDVGLVVEEAELVLVGLLALEHDKVVVEVIALDQRVRHLDPLGLHRVLLAEVVVRYRVVVQVAHLPHTINLQQITATPSEPPALDAICRRREDIASFPFITLA